MRVLAIAFFATQVFAQTPDSRAWELIDQGVHNTNPIKRRQCVVAMGVIRPQPMAVALLESALDDRNLGVREAACITLGEIDSRSSIPKLQMALADAAPEVIFAAAKALYTMGDSTGRQVLTAILSGDQKDASGFFSSSVYDAKTKLHDPRALILLGVREGSGLAGPFGAGVPFALDLMKDKQSSGKTVAALLLATDRTPETQRALKDALSEKNWTVRAAAARAIALRDATDLYDDLALLLEDKRDEVRFAASAALVRLKQPRFPGPAK